MKCFFGHNYKATKVEYNYHYNRDDNSPTGEGQTLIYEKCQDCNKINYRRIDGVWELEDINEQEV